MRLVVLATVLVAGCAAVSGPMAAMRFDAATTSELWILHHRTASSKELALIEAELASRGETNTYSDYIGRRTAAAFGKKLYSREEKSEGDRDCVDFPSAAAAQKFFLTAGGPARDRHGLDRDGDGLACEWGTQLTRSASKGTKRISPTRSYSRSYSRCYVGSRGGTYTISSSGQRNYGGC